MMSPEYSPIQEREFTPVGTTAVMRADIRLVAATNKKLDREVADGRFRGRLRGRT